ncbi:MAG: hypothetical protein HQK49_15905 [Oligoflexia bacterium]|nr:hypothetical protein [Oligoflexia bacterium]
MRHLNFISILIVLSVLFALNACTTYRPAESFENKMSRFSVKNEQQPLTPEIPVMINYKFNNPNDPNNNRNVASVNDNNLQSLFLTFSNRKLYFMTLYDQYRTLKTLLKDKYNDKYNDNDNDNDSDIELCPQFHSGLLSINSSYGKRKINRNQTNQRATTTPLISLYPISSNIQKVKSLALYPELALPITFNSKHPTVYEFITTHQNKKNVSDQEQNDEQKNEQMKLFVDALRLHLEKNIKELKEMCEYGHSDQYYLFENLITHMKNNKSFRKSKESMEALLKTTIVSNMAIITSLDLELKISNRIQAQTQNQLQDKNRLPSSLNTDIINLDSLQQEVLTRLDAEWSKQYFNEMKRLRMNDQQINQ